MFCLVRGHNSVVDAEGPKCNSQLRISSITQYSMEGSFAPSYREPWHMECPRFSPQHLSDKSSVVDGDVTDYSHMRPWGI